MKRPLPPELTVNRPGIDANVSHPEQGMPVGSAPRKYTKAVHEHIVDKVRKGIDPGVAAESAGIPVRTFDQWMRMGEAGNIHLEQFYTDVSQAVANVEVEMVELITDADSSYRDPKFFLERGRSKRWSPRVTTQVTNELEEALSRLEQGLTGEEYQKVLSILSK